jgi:leucyl/phenylalanyl-tRNA--protein transferase
MLKEEKIFKLLHSAHSKNPKLVNFILGILYPFHPSRINSIPAIICMTLKYWIDTRRSEDRFPNLEKPFKRPAGLVAIGGSLSTERLILAYRNGIYPWCHVGPVKWWAPSERMVLFLEESHISKNLRRTIKQSKFKITFDKAFNEVILACAEPRPKKLPLTWISAGIIDAYMSLYLQGYAHSVEAWDSEGNLAGGLFGVALGGVFFTESLFARKSDASKVAFVTLNCHLQRWGFKINDCKAYTEHHSSLGAKLIKRKEFMKIIEEVRDKKIFLSSWKVDESLDIASWDPSQ